VLERLALRGGETVLDAGCGSGRVTRHLIERLPAGRVIAVDSSPSMITQARKVLRPQDEAVVSDLLELEFGEAVDAVFSTATFHWISDHERLFARLRSMLRPGGRLLAQCGGEGNVARTVGVIRSINEEGPFRAHLGGSSDPWNFASAEQTFELLEGAGFGEVECWLSPKRVQPDEPRAFAEAVCLGAELDRLPAGLHEQYVDRFLAMSGEPLVLDYVRLNIEATRA
jgi:trans-aconitate 2-methyltransferase